METTHHHQKHETNNATRIADNMANAIENISFFLKNHWRTVFITAWVLGVTLTQIQMSSAIKKASSFHQVANLKLSVNDIRYSVVELETEMDRLERSISRVESSISEMQSTLSRIHTQGRSNNL